VTATRADAQPTFSTRPDEFLRLADYFTTVVAWSFSRSGESCGLMEIFELKLRSDFGIGNCFVEFPPPGKSRARSGGATPTEMLNDRLADFSDTVDKLEAAFKAVHAVAGIDGNPLVDTEGVEPKFCAAHRQLLIRVGDELSFWDRTYRRRHGVAAQAMSDVETDGLDEDEFEHTEFDEDVEVEGDAPNTDVVIDAAGGVR
jgi:hypothetical protein